MIDGGWISYIVEKADHYSTLLLVVITSIYVCITYKILKEARNQNEIFYRPLIRIKMLKDKNEPILLIKNIGKGPALNVRYYYGTMKEDFLRTFETVSKYQKEGGIKKILFYYYDRKLKRLIEEDALKQGRGTFSKAGSFYFGELEVNGEEKYILKDLKDEKTQWFITVEYQSISGQKYSASKKFSGLEDPKIELSATGVLIKE